jgi:hypothetical protein
MKTSEVLAHAKRYLAATRAEKYNYQTMTGKEKFICIAIMTAASHTESITNGDIDRCRLMIEARLEGCGTIEEWLQVRGFLPFEWGLVDTPTRDRIQQHRHAWLDMLIKEFKAKED